MVPSSVRLRRKPDASKPYERLCVPAGSDAVAVSEIVPDAVAPRSGQAVTPMRLPPANPAQSAREVLVVTSSKHASRARMAFRWLSASRV